MAEIAVSAAKVLVETVLHALSQMQNIRKTLHDEVKGLSFCLHRLDAYLADMEGNEGSEQLRERAKEVRDVAFHIEDVLEDSVHELLSKITGVKGMIVALDKLGFISSRTRMEEGSTSGPKPDHQLAPNIPGDEETMGFEEREEAIILQLTDQELRDVTISVVGPGGSSKTTIVNKVSQSFNIEELFCSMLKQFCKSKEEPIPSGGSNTQAKLRHYLQQKSYVVLDDIWRKEHWEWIHTVLPRGSSCSRIIVTTRNLDVASFCVGLDFVGQARYCRVLNLMHEFIDQKSEEVNFFLQIGELDASSNKNVRRISIDNSCINLAQIRGLNYVCSAFLFKKSNLSASANEHVLHAFKLMRVLDLRDAPLDKFPEAIILLNLLRYLCLRNTKIKEIPNSIKKLSHLETLDLKQTKVTILPKGILQLCNLRHFLISWYNIKNYVTWHSVVGVKIARGISALTNLQKLSLIKSDKHHEIVKELKALTQLRKLGLVDLKREGGKYLCASVEKMVDLSTLTIRSTNKDESLDLDDMQSPPLHLRHLYLKGHLLQFPRWISKLDNLFRIGLKWSRLQNSPLDTLQELPNLLELEMVDAFTGEELVFEAGKFKKLKMLHIELFEQLDTVGSISLLWIEKFGLYDMPVEFTNRLQKTHEDHGMLDHVQLLEAYSYQSTRGSVLFLNFFSPMFLDFIFVVSILWKFSRQSPVGKYDLLDLKEVCQESLLGDIGATNMLDRLQNACLYQLLKLKENGFALSL
ncbi:hypothetical protein RHSIM_Rhsim04G0009600 [Rhododendron simsii]|uniref:Uncharacterized protein n=1 Tax=Rhododendron simsii TaxID=118357 RepID=A0A834H7B4_RHOSS|nr:hypothetical protein RHSIM_Rhsim04G0009600 [Rhododendron simsii]